MTSPVFLLDSNILIYILDGQPLVARERLQRRRNGAVVTSAIAYAEVVLGLARQRSDAMVVFQRLMQRIPVLPFDEMSAMAYRAVPFRRGRFDRLIGAHALSLGLTVVTANETDFADIPGLKVENWTLPL